jgi:hypothetical protein
VLRFDGALQLALHYFGHWGTLAQPWIADIMPIIG